MRYADERVDRTLDGETDVTRERAFRDRAIVYLLGLSGVRGAEVFAEPSDDKRAGITWGDVQLDAGDLVSTLTDAADDLGVAVEIVDADGWEYGEAMGVCQYEYTADQPPLVEAKVRPN